VGSDPNDAASTPDDLDGDGSPNTEEKALGTDPLDPNDSPTTSALIVQYVDGFDPAGQVVGAELVTNSFGPDMTLGSALGLNMYVIDFPSSIPVGDAREISEQMAPHPDINYVEPDSVVGHGGGGGFGFC